MSTLWFTYRGLTVNSSRPNFCVTGNRPRVYCDCRLKSKVDYRPRYIVIISVLAWVGYTIACPRLHQALAYPLSLSDWLVCHCTSHLIMPIALPLALTVTVNHAALWDWKPKKQYLITCKVNRYDLLALTFPRQWTRLHDNLCQHDHDDGNQCIYYRIWTYCRYGHCGLKCPVSYIRLLRFLPSRIGCILF